jgi:lysophospholipase L1-like esterase
MKKLVLLIVVLVVLIGASFFFGRSSENSSGKTKDSYNYSKLYDKKTDFPVPDSINYESKHKIRILFIGNSLTYFKQDGNDKLRNELAAVLSFLSKIQTNNKFYIDAQSITLTYGGIENHWKNPKVQKSLDEDWDFIVLQGRSKTMMNEVNIEIFDEHIKKFLDKIDKEKTKIILYSTAARHPGHKAYYKKVKYDYNTMLNTIQNEYYKFASKYNVGLVYTGIHFHEFMFDPLFKMNLYAGDGFHPNQYGTFVIAMSFLKYLNNNNDIDFECEAVSNSLDLDVKACNNVKFHF